jgi:hypothetical protein
VYHTRRVERFVVEVPDTDRIAGTCGCLAGLARSCSQGVGDAFGLDSDPLASGDALAILDHIWPNAANQQIGSGCAPHLSSNGLLNQDDDIIFTTTSQAAVRL